MTISSWVPSAWGGRLVTEERLARAHRRRHRVRIAVLALAAPVLAGSAWAVLAATLPSPVARKGGVSLWRTDSGLLFATSFGRPTPLRDLEDAFSFGGSAKPGIGYADAEAVGLSVGVRRHPPRYEGWFAVTREAFPASGVYHVVMAKPPGEVRSRGAQGEAVFAVQTGMTKASGLINYVVVASNSHGGATAWSVGYAAGHIANARLQRFLRIPAPATSPDARPVTVETNGRNRLAVWLGEHLVFVSDHLHLQIAPPFQVYLEVQSRLVPYAARFRDFWVASATAISISAPDRARLRLIAADGNTLATATARNGEAKLALPPPNARGTAVLVVRDAGRVVRLGPFEYTGGDRYRVSGLGSERSR